MADSMKERSRDEMNPRNLARNINLVSISQVS